MFTESVELQYLLAPISPDHFFRDTWEKVPLAIHRDAGHFAGLFARRDLDAVVAYSRPRFTDTSAFQPPGPRSPTYVRGMSADQAAAAVDQPSIAELRQIYERGKSVVIMAMQHRWPAIARLSRGLEAAFHCPVHANLYLTPPGSQGFAAHFDTHEVFILQLDGVKHWRLYGDAEHLPLASDAAPLTRRPGKPAQEITLEAGDLLYIPRGHIHEASTATESSLHLTIGVNVYRWADLLHHALTCISRQDDAFREAIPGGALPEGKARLKHNFQSLLKKLACAAQAEDLFEQAFAAVGDQFFGQLQMLPCGQFAGHDACGEIELDTPLSRNRQAICRVLENEQGVAIEFPGNRVGGPPRIASALRFIAGRANFTARELPDDLSEEARLVLVRRLVREGLLNVAAPPVAIDDADRSFFDGAILSEENHVNDVRANQLAEAVGYVGGQGLVG
ncbi:MAG: cupin domain-containing protein [Pirellulales bacterium]